MIYYPAHCPLFEFASVPRTGSTWFMHACYEVGLGGGSKSKVHEYFPEGKSTLPRITIVRHPCDWLMSYFHCIFPAKIGLDIDELASICWQHDAPKSFDQCIRLVIENHPGIVGRIFSQYKADVYLRTDSINESFYELCLSLGIPKKHARKARSLKPINSGWMRCKWNPALYDRILDLEKDFVNQYDF